MRPWTSKGITEPSDLPLRSTAGRPNTGLLNSSVVAFVALASCPGTPMRFLNPKTDYAFKKIFGSEASRDILISFLNAILDLSGDEAIIDVVILDPRLVPKIDGMKDTYLDVRVQDQRGCSYIVEMQVLNVEGFEKRVLYNACKAYVNQLGKGDPYHILSEVVAVTITDFTMFPDLERVVSRFRLRADENPAICHQDLELVFAELPKFTKAEADLSSTLDRWLYFLKTARDLAAIPRSLADDPAIVHAFELANRAGWTEEELDFLETRERWIADQQYIHKKAQAVEQRALDAEQKAIEARSEGKAEGKAEMLLRLLRRRFSNLPTDIEARVRAADSDQLDGWSERFVDARELEDIELYGE